MSRLPLMCLMLTAAGVGVGRAVSAEESNAPATPAKTESPTVVTPATPATTPVAAAEAKAPASPPARPRPMSPVLASQISSLAPKYEPVAATRTIEPGTDLREIDKPRNTIIRLPNFEVQEDKAPVVKPPETLTPQQRLDLALKRHPGLRLGTFWIFRNDGIALTMLAEEERLERMKDMNDLLTLLPASQQKQMRPAVDDAFARKELPR